ncbi:hypothetical protein BJ165DRAFT_1344644, partial [Panaeolus papilionaceus]
IIIGQTCWFFLQLLVRLITGLNVLQLEISTLTFAVLSVIVCGLWWNKPFDMRSPIIVRGIHTPRAVLMILPLIALRDIAPRALINISWTSYIPHL